MTSLSRKISVNWQYGSYFAHARIYLQASKERLHVAKLFSDTSDRSVINHRDDRTVRVCEVSPASRPQPVPPPPPTPPPALLPRMSLVNTQTGSQVVVVVQSALKLVGSGIESQHQFQSREKNNEIVD